MTREEMVDQVKFLEEQRDKTSDPTKKRNFQTQIDFLNDQIREMDRSRSGRSTAQNVVGVATRIVAGAASMVVGEVDACVTGRTDEKQVRRRRGKFVDSAENAMVRVTGAIENIFRKK